MIISIKDANDVEIATIEVADDTSPDQVAKIRALFTPRVKSMGEIVNERLRHFRSLAPELLIQLYIENTLSGMTTVQSDALFEEYSDVIIRLNEGAWPSALHRLNQKVPGGNSTQEMIDRWKQMIIERL